MLMPKRVKYRKMMRGRLKGLAQRGNQVTFGSFGLQAMERHLVTSRQIEAARRAIVRYIRSSPCREILDRLPNVLQED